ncbi:hypothetical protein JB92DRAFT_2825653 [Gautieria morchelliformis]|nr:hypothetical protein JB92DRAFT_2825653 [Gautieria morchelliformis]
MSGWGQQQCSTMRLTWAVAADGVFGAIAGAVTATMVGGRDCHRMHWRDTMAHMGERGCAPRGASRACSAPARICIVMGPHHAHTLGSTLPSRGNAARTHGLPSMHTRVVHGHASGKGWCPSDYTIGWTRACGVGMLSPRKARSRHT